MLICNSFNDSGNLPGPPSATHSYYGICEMSPEHPCSPCQEYIDLEAQISGLKTSLALMLSRQKELRPEINRCHDPLTRHLPIEIVLAIFEVYVFDHPWGPDEHFPIIQNGRSPLVLGAVCRSWRQISCSSPKLWTRLEVYVRRPDDWNCLEITQMWLDRSLKLPLTIYLSIDQPDPMLAVDPREVFSRLIFLINQQSSRWLNLRLSCSPVFLPLIRGDGLGAPILQTLMISLPYVTDDTDPVIFTIGGVKCRPIYFRGFNVRFQSVAIDWSRVTKLYFVQRTGTPLDQFVELLRQAPQLIECEIPIVIDPELPIPFPQSKFGAPIRHNLRSLNFGHYRGIVLNSISKLLTFPQLTHLTLTSVLDRHLECFADIITCSSCPITYLKLNDVVCGNEELLSLLKCTLSLQKLELIQCIGRQSDYLEFHRLLTGTSTAADTSHRPILPYLQYFHRSDFYLLWDALFWAHLLDILKGPFDNNGHDAVPKHSLQTIRFTTPTFSMETGPTPTPVCMDENVVSQLIERLSKPSPAIDLWWNGTDMLQASMRHHGLVAKEDTGLVIS